MMKAKISKVVLHLEHPFYKKSSVFQSLVDDFSLKYGMSIYLFFPYSLYPGVHFLQFLNG